ncbi:bifunctional ADP-dependent NAD(P)H-hydrate dehydratase/NAD(P)H-hydrate epimerase [Wenxinia saemankumensis]|uniref:Bifunctional NAD(P)H-hydrate repair enzyme n=1 Tax=Wenxinia saemankumensis TaxID=1447782 RepID=A0A1M6EY82_9RHOB|nr:bifunctional ADP-dependent NAD(P)H-hydrate dehydratase/NAD(P)H-hydrate epimerase [Wenxinia saemankumensis]SHI90418.1 yjeF C-terminal region, hydroxyethylthiazole kinase-related/yjeF N-terminal region [Wenxinia saemankumensis]
MIEILTAEQMRAAEQAAMERGAATGSALMERAGQGVVDAVLAEWPDLAVGSRRARVLCGPGNNGGDGFVVARLLRERGWAVELDFHGTPGGQGPDAAAARAAWERTGPADPAGDPEKLDLVVDALFGTGLTRGVVLDPGLAGIFRRLMAETFWATGSQQRPYVVAVDIPSGLDADSGRVLAPLPEDLARIPGGADAADVGAHLTVTFHRPKPGHVLAEGPARCGRLAVVDLGLAEAPAVDRAGPVRLVDRPAARPAAGRPGLSKARPGPGAADHKYSHGSVLVLSGGVGRGGAARMTARAALRIGAGAVTLLCPPAALIENAAQLDAIMLRPVKDPGQLADLLAEGRDPALCLGPGLGTGAREVGLVAAALDGGGPAVLDADALTLLARDADLFARLHAGCVLTPHAGEFARLFPDLADRIEGAATRGPAASKVDIVRAAARRAGCTLLLKGPDTVIADPDGTCAVNLAAYDRAAPWLATAGAGDVLAGFVAGLLARGFAPREAAEVGAWLHVECARAHGPGLIAEELPEALPGVLRALGA